MLRGTTVLDVGMPKETLVKVQGVGLHRRARKILADWLVEVQVRTLISLETTNTSLTVMRPRQVSG